MNNMIYQELIDEDNYFDVRSDKRLYLDLRASSEYVKEAKKLEPNDLKINLHIMLKNAAIKKIKAKSLASFIGRISVYFN